MTTTSVGAAEAAPVVRTAVASDPFGFDDVFLFSHGWSTDADRAAIDYDVFSIGLMRRLLLHQREAALAHPPRPSLELGIHWPSEITEDPSSVLNDAQLFTFFTMRQRADAVGRNLVYSLLRLALQQCADRAVRLFLLGHSFGCKVVCAALQDIQTDIAGGTISVHAETQWRVVLMEAATDWDNLEPTDIYGNVGKLANLRLLLTTSQMDRAVCEWYPAASRIANFFHGANPTPALGCAGPTDATVRYFGGRTDTSVIAGYRMSAAEALAGKLVVADLTPVHRARANANPPLYSGGMAGSHSDLYFDEIYNLVGGFLYA